jgi:glycogen debranching enzyme
MPVQLSVGPPVITINQDVTFMVTDLNGEISAETEQGIFCGDTRFVSHYRVYASDTLWKRITSSAIAYNVARLYFANQELVTPERTIPAETLSLEITRAVSRFAVGERFSITNHNRFPVEFNLEIELRSDFADLFEVKSHTYVHRSNINAVWDLEHGVGTISYIRGDFERILRVHVGTGDSPPRFANGRWVYTVALEPGATWNAEYRMDFEVSEYVGRRLAPHATAESTALTREALTLLQEQWLDRATKVTSANEDVNRAYRQSVEDMGALRLYTYGLGPNVWVPAAGVPWFVTLFGRDSLVVSLQNVLVDPGFAPGALELLASFQANERDDWRDAQPGKILHELRVGELTHFGQLPFRPYYGTWDATTFYLIVLHEAWKWLGDDALLRKHRDTALRCLDWIDQYGDLDGDGFQEYKTFSTRGYENMGWKDAGDAVVYPDGSQVKQPKALCELQGYVYDAWLRMAEVFDRIGEPDRASDLRRKAGDLQQRFEDKFWCDDIGFYAYGLDPDKQQIKSIASNPGHCLWSGIASPDRAAKVVRRFFEPDMWSGWGIRTISNQNPAYNPFSYQLGSVWPHDNGIIAMGMKRYGFAAEAARVANDVIAAASYFVSYRLPELYAGIAREEYSFPVQYLGANVPQAWAAGCMFHFLQAMLGIQADAPQNVLTVDPALPDWLPDITLRGVEVGASSTDLRFWREGNITRWAILAQQGKVSIQQKAWEPWAAPRAPKRTQKR